MACHQWQRKMTQANKKGWEFLLVGVLIAGTVVFGCSPMQNKARVYRICVLLSGDIRLEAFSGLKDGLRDLGYVEGENVIFEVMNAKGDRSLLPELARSIGDREPDLAVAGGGIEADALKAATETSDIPVVFLSVSSAVDRGLVASLRSSENNFTGVETNDTPLTAKRLELITQMLPDAQRVLILFVPSITPAAKAVEVAEETAPRLGLELKLLAVETEQDIRAAVVSIAADTADSILLVPAAPVRQLTKEVLYPLSIAHQIPIVSYNRTDLELGALMSYAGSRYANGVQAARMVDRILQGTSPADIPVETPQKLELVINRLVVDRLGLELSDEAWNLADDVVEIEVE
jgi:putative ABC transport system substrate-binding protein